MTGKTVTQFRYSLDEAFEPGPRLSVSAVEDAKVRLHIYAENDRDFRVSTRPIEQPASGRYRHNSYSIHSLRSAPVES